MDHALAGLALLSLGLAQRGPLLWQDEVRGAAGKAGANPGYDKRVHDVSLRGAIRQVAPDFATIITMVALFRPLAKREYPDAGCQIPANRALIGSP
jgi:hypothetical protein